MTTHLDTPRQNVEMSIFDEKLAISQTEIGQKVLCYFIKIYPIKNSQISSMLVNLFDELWMPCDPLHAVKSARRIKFHDNFTARIFVERQ